MVKMKDKSISYGDFVSFGLIRNLELLAADNNCVLWIRNKEYDQQLYLSHTYTTLWGRDCLSVYKDPFCWSESLNVKDAESFYNELKLQRTIINPVYTSIFCINLPNGQQRWFQDRSFQLPVTTHHQKIIAGCALHVADKERIDYDQENISEKLDFIITKYYQILTAVYHQENPKVIKNQDLLKMLSKREKEILMLFIQGKTITQVAEMIHLSPRTVEGYLTNLKSKLLCESKSDLIMKAIENGWISLNVEM